MGSSSTAGGSPIRWHPWPCGKCGKRTSALGYLLNCYRAGAEIPSQLEQIRDQEASWLLRWVKKCDHVGVQYLAAPKLTEGSEHAVYLDEAKGTVFKLTHPSIYGDYYYLVDGMVNQEICSPAQYLARLRFWSKLFGLAPSPLGITDRGQILTRQKFVTGEAPSQEQVDNYLKEIGLIPVKQSRWLWKYKTLADESMELWVGDARSDNFVLNGNQMFAIDIRVWLIPADPKGRD